MRTRIEVVVGLLVVAFGAGTARAADSWSDPFPGVRRLHRVTSNQNINALVIDTCAAGVGVRATAYAERGRTVPSFGALVGAQAVVNADFFGPGYATDGLAMSAGALWPGASDHGYVSPVAFGPRRIELIAHEIVAGAEPWMTEIVSGHPTILLDGVVRPSDGDPLCSNRHPRTAIGLSADRRTLILVVVDGRATSRIGMRCDELATLLQELGAVDGNNLDGGGSSTMWLQGAGVVNNPSDGSPRTVGNHLAVYARGAGDAPFCPNRAPRGWLDATSCERVRGWAQDEDAPDVPVDVHLYFGGPAGAPGAVGIATRADLHRDDLCGAIGSCAHGFSAAPPAAFMDGQAHEVWAYGIDGEGGPNAALAGSPLVLQCDPPAPPLAPDAGIRRHVSSPEVLAAWGFALHDVAPLGAATLDAFIDGPPLPTAPELVRATGEPAVYVLDDDTLRHVGSPESMDAWRFDWDAVLELAPAELAAHPTGQPWPAAPFLARGDGAAVYMIDRAATPPGAPDDPLDPPDPDSDPEPMGPAGGDALTGGCSAAAVRADRAASLALYLLVVVVALACARPRRR